MGDAPSISAIMEANFSHNLPLGAFARMCHRSLSTFKREFRQCYGVTPAKWLISRRLECAAQMLRTTRQSAMEIAFECGFEDPAHFSRAFRAKFGCPPTVYREHEAKNNPNCELMSVDFSG
jgi:AraC-like DNA-binding protein